MSGLRKVRADHGRLPLPGRKTAAVAGNLRNRASLRGGLVAEGLVDDEAAARPVARPASAGRPSDQRAERRAGGLVPQRRGARDADGEPGVDHGGEVQRPCRRGCVKVLAVKVAGAVSRPSMVETFLVLGVVVDEEAAAADAGAVGLGDARAPRPWRRPRRRRCRPARGCRCRPGWRPGRPRRPLRPEPTMSGTLGRSVGGLPCHPLSATAGVAVTRVTTVTALRPRTTRRRRRLIARPYPWVTAVCALRVSGFDQGLLTFTARKMPRGPSPGWVTGRQVTRSCRRAAGRSRRCPTSAGRGSLQRNRQPRRAARSRPPHGPA